MVLTFVAKSIISAPVRLLAVISEHRRMAQAIAQLEALNDRTLEDIGIERQDIPYVVRHGRD
jgi:uncharacterized protein YjiS (DUF1127 family)